MKKLENINRSITSIIYTNNTLNDIFLKINFNTYNVRINTYSVWEMISFNLLNKPIFKKTKKKFIKELL